eukprot:TRINITY_DN8872_c0_g1_i1.p1 TRINITY_DN8872_c0_g1~~TRINITY_DN8872_c0_g1_i1.p1  ORF type:complete len:75 (+),score=30.05 TRINITY_DN8872_c0_g1_i1:45-269(+)
MEMGLCCCITSRILPCTRRNFKVLGTALGKAGDARIKLAKILAKYGAADYQAPSINNKTQAQEKEKVPTAWPLV